MSQYVERSVKEALKITKGDTLKARKQVIAWALEDDRLLQELVKPHLNGIIAYNIERVASGRSEKSKSLEPLTRKAKAKADARDKFGMEILKAVVDNDAAIFGFEDQPGRRKSASQDHIDAIKKLASKSKSKSDK